MVWKECEDGIWLDDLDGAEEVFYNMSQAFARVGKEHGSVTAVCEFGVQSALKAPLETIFRDAWKALRFDFPALSVIADGSKKKYVAATAERVEQWVMETFSVNTTHPANDLVPTLYLKKLPCLIVLPQSSEVIFHCSHWRIDALGTCTILDRLFDLISQNTTVQSPRWNLEYQNLSPSLEDAFGCPRICSPAMEAMAETIRTRNFETSYPSAGLPLHSGPNIEPLSSQHQDIEITAKATSDLITACKAHNISITAAIHAACAEAVFDRSKHNNNHDYSTVVSANVRHLLPSSAPQQQHHTKTTYACGTYVTGITHTVRRADDFITRSSQLTKAYKGDWMPKDYMTALRPIYQVHGEALLAAAAAATNNPTRPPASNVTVSSLGVVDRYLRSEHGTVVVEKFRLGSAIMTRQPTLYIWTFRGRLTMSVDYNEAYYSVDTMRALLESIRCCLEKELSVSIGVACDETKSAGYGDRI